MVEQTRDGNPARARPPNRKIIILGCLVALLVAGAAVHLSLPRYDVQATDTYYVYLDAGQLVHGNNPYAAALAGNMRQNQKFATYFPAFYLLGAATQGLGWRDFVPWVSLWRVIFLAANLAAGGLLFWLLYRAGHPLFGLIATALWLFDRWNLQSTQVANLDFLPLALLLLSFILLPRRRTAALLVFGLSLALKQIAIFLVPLYLIYTWRAAAPPRRVRETLLAALAIAAVPLVVSLPFIVWNAEAFVRSIVFSFTREAAAHIDAPSLDALLKLPPEVGRGLMLLIMLGAAAAYALGEIGFFVAALVIMAAFVDLNSVLFIQYFCWLAPFVPLAALDALQPRPPRAVDQSPG